MYDCQYLDKITQNIFFRQILRFSTFEQKFQFRSFFQFYFFFSAQKLIGRIFRIVVKPIPKLPKTPSLQMLSTVAEPPVSPSLVNPFPIPNTIPKFVLINTELGLLGKNANPKLIVLEVVWDFGKELELFVVLSRL